MYVAIAHNVIRLACTYILRLQNFDGVLASCGPKRRFGEGASPSFIRTFNANQLFFVFIPKKANFGTFWKTLGWKLLVYFMAIWHFFVNLVYFMGI
jgi:hypothetical protein